MISPKKIQEFEMWASGKKFNLEITKDGYKSDVTGYWFRYFVEYGALAAETEYFRGKQDDCLIGRRATSKRKKGK